MGMKSQTNKQLRVQVELNLCGFTAAVDQTSLQGFMCSYWDVWKDQVICTLEEN